MRGSLRLLSALLGLLVLVSELSLALTPMLPYSGDVVLDVETICRRYDSTDEPIGNTTVRFFRMAGNTANPLLYPFYVKERAEFQQVIWQYASSSQRFMQTNSWWCTESLADNSNDDYVHIWKLLQSWIVNFDDMKISNTSSVTRDINTLTWTLGSISGVIPESFGGQSSTVTGTLTATVLASSWTINSAAVSLSPLSFQFTATSSEETLSCGFNFAYYGVEMNDTTLNTLPSSCDDNGVMPDEDPASTDDETVQVMPSFPPAFTANFQVIMPAKKKIWSMTASYDSYASSSKTTAVSVRPDNIGRITQYEWYVDGSTQMSYFHEFKGLTGPKSTLGNAALLDYFWPNREECRRAYIGYGGGETSTSSLLLNSPTVVPSFIGNQTVRDIPCGVWSALVDGARVTWFWATENTTQIATSADELGRSEYGHLVRMTVEGQGTSAPLFVHHPFFQQGYSMPATDRANACFYFGAADLPGCMDLDGSFFFIYDILGFSPSMAYTDTVLPEVCTATNVLTNTFPNFSCSMQGTGVGTVLVIVLVGIVCLLIGGCCVWIRLAPLIRSLQEDTINLAKELRRGEVLQATVDEQTNAETSATAPAPAANAATTAP